MSSKDTGSAPEQAVAGFFGKLPGRGDFIGRHLPKSFVDPWDAWLQEAMVQSRRQLGGLWRDYYCTSPMWRFALSAGVCGPVAYTGILMPSVDRVGRYYPLAIAVPLPLECALLALLTTAMAWYAQAEQLALAGLDHDRLDLDAFSRQVKALGDPPVALLLKGGSEDDGDLLESQAWYCPLPEPLKPTDPSTLLASDRVRHRLPQHSIWWTEGCERISRCLLICKGLPPPSGFAALLGGDWQDQGWIEKQCTAVVGCPGQPLTTGERLENP